MREHLRQHGQTWAQHFVVNCRFTLLGLWAAALTFGHALTPRVSGRQASALHARLWDDGRALSIADITHRVRAGMYPTRLAALQDLDDHLALYRETVQLAAFRPELERLLTEHPPIGTVSGR